MSHLIKCHNYVDKYLSRLNEKVRKKKLVTKIIET